MSRNKVALEVAEFIGIDTKNLHGFTIYAYSDQPVMVKAVYNVVDTEKGKFTQDVKRFELLPKEERENEC